MDMTFSSYDEFLRTQVHMLPVFQLADHPALLPF
jgi:hypothetical protein